MATDVRVRAVEAVLRLDPDLESVLLQLRRTTPLRDAIAATLTRAHISAALAAYSRGELSAQLLEDWAEDVHSAEDVDVAESDHGFLIEALFRLSTPELFGPMDDVVAQVRELRDAGP